MKCEELNPSTLTHKLHLCYLYYYIYSRLCAEEEIPRGERGEGVIDTATKHNIKMATMRTLYTK